ncbi:MAG: anaerobic ribonucleoside-triphosphate reductase activating protein [Euryarchaeota archaeon]|nr:anaerobic ribonucleoside-triphosphate reductase activating protein [Euryarchaeota archaeon]
MNIGGFQKTSLLDYPGCISAIVWTVGCNFRCPFCYNKHLVLGTKEKLFSEDEVFSFLSNRKGLLDGVVISGGEPLLQADIIDFIQKVKALGYLVKVDTNGTNPDKLKELFKKKLLDYVAMDVKAPKGKYPQLTGVKPDVDVIEQSITLIKDKAPMYEFRTTVVPELLKKEDVVEIAKWIKGAKRYYLQQFKHDVPLLSAKLEHLQPYTKEQLLEIAQKVQPYVECCSVRGV